jgi:hypothetical protein
MLSDGSQIIPNTTSHKVKILHICENFSSVLAGWTAVPWTLRSAGANTAFQLITILEEARLIQKRRKSQTTSITLIGKFTKVGSIF